MGLDNGIVLKIKDKEKFGKIPHDILNVYDYDAVRDESEFMYWRNCWGIREVIFDALHKYRNLPHNKDEFEIRFDLQGLKKLIYTLNECYTPDWWEDHNNSIWTFDDICCEYHENLLRAAELASFLRDKDPASYELYFYDSY